MEKLLTFIEKKESLSSLLNFLNSQHVKTFEYDGIKIEFQQSTYVSNVEPKIERPAPMSEEQKLKEEEELMFWSSGV